MSTFNEIKSRNDLADYLKVPRSKLTHVLYVKSVDSYYSEFEIPKKNGDKREISSPSGDLKDIQTRLTNALWNYQCELRMRSKKRTNISHAFEKEKGIITNARIHRNKRFVLNLDLKDFFDSIHFGRVPGFFEKDNEYLFPHEVAVVIAQLTCYKGKLPQGAPSSPIITNLICRILDMRILKIAKKFRLDYTRYADDMTFSTNWSGFLDVQDSFISEVLSDINKAGFQINEKKTRLLFRDSRQEVTGLVVNKKVNVNRKYIKQTKAMAHSLYKTGTFSIDNVEGTINQLEGRFAFIDQLDYYNNKLDKSKHDSYHLCRREKDYRAFIFFKYFFASETPIIITEGKTDIKYLQAALKSHYQRYPNLITKNDDGSYSFKISFLHRSKRWKYFFGVSLDGADAEKCLYRYFTGKQGCENYFKFFSEKYGCIQKSPVVFLFDNETESKRPLHCFLNENSQISDEEKTAVQKTLFLQLQKGSKLYLLTNPLIDGKKESEIEDLFSQDVLSVEINGKHFCKKDSFDTEKYFGKEKFSEYILSHFSKIDFSGFLPLLDALNAIISS